MAHVHSHAEDRNTYYLDQLFMIGISGALAGVTITLYYSGLLGRMLHPKFHIWVLAGGLSLLALVVLRAVAVWRSVDQEMGHGHSHDHGHPHSHDHDHDHGDGGCCGHDHDHGHDHGHDHDHDHDHDHHTHHHHEGGGTAVRPAAAEVQPGPTSLALAVEPASAPAAHVHAGHEHGWAPWRYVVLMLPVVLYFLILSNPSFDREPVATMVTPLDYIQNFIIRFRSIVWEALPFIVLGALIAGLLEELLPQQAIARILPRSRALAIGMGALLGLVFPMCECGIVPVMRRLLRKGLPLSCCVAYLLAGPVINVVVLTSTYVAFWGMENVFEGGKPSYQMGGWWMMGFRAGLAFIVAVVTALIVEWTHRRYGDDLLTPLARPSGLPLVEENGSRRRSLGERVNNISETALHDFVDITVFLILGALLSAGAGLMLTSDRVAELSREHVLLSIVLMMGLAVLLCLCSEADAFVAASFVTMRPAAKLAFLVLGPMLDLKLYLMYTRVFRRRLIWTIYTAVVLQVLLYSYVVHFIWEKNAPYWIKPVQQASRPVPPEASVAAARTWGLLSYPAGGGPFLAAAVQVAAHNTEDVTEIGFLDLEKAAQSPEQRAFYEGKRVKLVGRYVGYDERRFTLTRFRINCCAADAVPINAVIVLDPRSKEVLPAKKLLDKWVEVTGRVHFLTRPGTNYFLPALILSPTESTPLNKMVEVVAPPANPFLS
jgi:uncharacterized membrane protein YraQ (UPF0718 family)